MKLKYKCSLINDDSLLLPTIIFLSLVAKDVFSLLKSINSKFSTKLYFFISSINESSSLLSLFKNVNWPKEEEITLIKLQLNIFSLSSILILNVLSLLISINSLLKRTYSTL